MRSYPAGLFLLALAACSSPSDSGDREYSAEMIGGLPGTWHAAMAINASGQIAGHYRTPSGTLRGFRLGGSTIEDLTSASGNPGDTTRVIAINDAGWVVGYTAGPGMPAEATVWVPGQPPIQLGPWYARSYASDVSNRGEIVGYAFATGSIVSLRWTEADGVVELPTCAETHNSSAALGINELGQVVGYCTGASVRAFVWSDATGTILLPEGAGAVRSIARGVNDLGWVVGSVTDAAETYAAVWIPTGGGYELRRLQLPAGYSATNAVAAQINADGVVIGGADGRSIRWVDPSLPGELLPLPTSATRSAAMGVDHRGVIVGSAGDEQAGTSQATRWVP